MCYIMEQDYYNSYITNVNEPKWSVNKILKGPTFSVFMTYKLNLLKLDSIGFVEQ